ncbi:acetylornithine deacetylase [Tianweitania sediminis]|uniref:Acetylornithine deacetylase n=1 Tax=Tianweitania sediminis TaxID=1502156 RepID=A0A8J7UH32_9HYPH|nr:acetylornithine deacetylase [Tianweitania sediminis]MBP0437343.1 acetylornithine deacetylase [Tianweitania sediminis]
MTKTPSEIELLDRLVGFNTVSSRSNLDLIDFVRFYLEGLGVSSTILPDASGKKANLLASIGPVDVPGYVLSGHTDVVPVEGQEWSRDPFMMWRENDRLYGRGTTDMKGFVACMLARVPAMLAEPLAAPFHLALSYDEEVGCLGAYGLVDHMVETLPEQLAVFVGEPTEMGVVGGHKGSTGLLTTIAGKACHSSRPDLGVNAIFHAMDLIGELRHYAQELRATPDAGSPFELPYTTVGVGVIQGGTARNAIPGDVRFQWDIRATKAGIVETLVDRFRAYSDAKVLPVMKAGFEGSSISTEFAYDVPPLVPSEGSLAETLAKRFAGTNHVGTVNYGSEAGIFQRAGMPTIVCGPGRDSEAHITDEWIAVEQMQRCTAFLDGLIGHARRS